MRSAQANTSASWARWPPLGIADQIPTRLDPAKPLTATVPAVGGQEGNLRKMCFWDPPLIVETSHEVLAPGHEA